MFIFYFKIIANGRKIRLNAQKMFLQITLNAFRCLNCVMDVEIATTALTRKIAGVAVKHATIVNFFDPTTQHS